MNISSFSTLLQEAKNWSGRSDISDEQYHSFTYFVGSMANQLLRVGPMEYTAIADITPDGRVVIPPDFLELRSITARFNDKDSKPLQRISWDQFVNYNNNPTQGDDQPRYFSRQGSYFFLNPLPPAGSKATVHYFRSLPDINEVDQTNWLIQVSPLTYFYGTMHFLYMFVMDEERSAWWLEKLQGEMTRVQMIFDNAEYSGATMAIRSREYDGDSPYGI